MKEFPGSRFGIDTKSDNNDKMNYMGEGGESGRTPLSAIQENLRRFLTRHPAEKGQKGKAPIAPLTREGKTPLQDTRDQQTPEMTGTGQKVETPESKI